MGGWFRKEIKTVEDLKGLKMRIGGFAGRVLQKLGAVPQQIAGGDIYPALEKGTIDAAEWVGPYDDEKLGFYKVAQYYYYPGWWEGGADAALLSSIMTSGTRCRRPTGGPRAGRPLRQHLDDGEIRSRSIRRRSRRLLAGGAKLHGFSPADHGGLLQGGERAATLRSQATNASFKKVYDSMTAFTNDGYSWFQVAEFDLRQLHDSHAHCAADRRPRSRRAPEQRLRGRCFYACCDRWFLGG